MIRSRQERVVWLHVACSMTQLGENSRAERGTSTELPGHVQKTISTISDIHAAHRERASPAERAMARLTEWVGRPWFVGALTVVLAMWVSINVLGPKFGLRAIDPPPFPWLELLVSVAALYLVILILVTQRRDDELAAQREVLMLELAAANDQKIAKLIELLEEFRSDLPEVPDRVDEEADEMASRTDPKAILEAISEIEDDSDDEK